MSQKFGVKLKKVKRYHYRGQLYVRVDEKTGETQEYAVSRELRDHLVGSGYFIDCLIDAAPEPLPIATSATGAQPVSTEGLTPGQTAGEKKSVPAPPVEGDKGDAIKLKLREPSSSAVQVG